MSNFIKTFRYRRVGQYCLIRRSYPHIPALKCWSMADLVAQIPAPISLETRQTAVEGLCFNCFGNPIQPVKAF